MNGYISTTQMLRNVHKVTGGHITKALDLLDTLRREHPEAAYGAMRVLKQRCKKHAGVTHFFFGGYGFVRVERRESNGDTLLESTNA